MHTPLNVSDALRVLDEISEVLDERQSVTVEDLEKLNYLEQVRKALPSSCSLK